MAFSLIKFLKGLKISQENTTTPASIIITPAGSASTTTTVQASQTVDRTLTLPDATDTLVGKATTDVFTNKTLSGNVATNLINATGTTNFPDTGTITIPAATDTLVGKATTDTLSNKSLVDASTSIVDSVDATKQIKFDASGATATSTTLTGSQTVNRILTLPDATDTLVGKATTDTLTNKTLTAPAITSPTMTGTVTVPTTITSGTAVITLPSVTSTLATSAGTETLSNKSLVDASTSIVDSVDATKQIKFDAAGATATSTTITGSQSADRVLTLPDATDTLVGKATTDTLTNKTLTAPVLTSPTITGTLDSAATTTSNVSTSNVASSVSIGTGSGANTINIGGANSTIVLAGTSIVENTVNKGVLDKLITINKGGAATTGGGTGLEIEEAAAITGYVKTTGDRLGYELKAPGSAGIVTLSIGAANDTITVSNATQTLTNKSLVDSSTVIIDATDDTKQIKFDAAGATATSTTITGSQTVNRILTLPDATDTLVGKATTDTLTNKDIDGGTASNTSRITLPKAAKTVLDGLTRKAGTVVFDTTSNKPYYDDGTQLQLVGSGSGGGAANFITNGNAETGVVGWSTYKDAAASRPVDGTGGVAAAVTFTRSTTAPLIGDASFLFTKSAVNGQGEGASFDFTINAEDKAKVLTISMSNLVDSGTFTAGTSTSDSDVIVYLYDITNAVLIEPSSFKFLSNSTTISDKFQATFQTASNSTSYRLILHCATATTAAYTLKLDSIAVSPSTYVYGTPVTDLTNLGTITITSTGTSPTKGTIANDAIRGRRVGDHAHLKYEYKHTAAGTSGTGDYLFALPTGMSFDSNKVTLYTGQVGARPANNPAALGSVTLSYNANIQAFGQVVPYDATRFRLLLIAVNSTNNPYTFFASPTDVPFGVASYSISADFEAPIQGWSSSVQTSDQTDTRVVAASYGIGSNVSIPTGGVDVVWNSSILDTHAMMNTTNGVVTINTPGEYRLSANLRIDTGASVASQHVVTFACSNAGNIIVGAPTDLIASKAYLYTPNIIVRLRAGETFKVNLTSATNASTLIAGQSYVSIERISGPSAIAASEEIDARYTTTATTAISNTPAILPFNTKDYDTHNAYNTSTGLYTVPTTGKYRVTTKIITASVTLTTNQNLSVSVYKNGSSFSELNLVAGNGSGGNYRVAGADTVSCIAGDTLAIWAAISVSSTLLGSGCQVTFERVK